MFGRIVLLVNVLVVQQSQISTQFDVTLSRWPP